MAKVIRFSGFWKNSERAEDNFFLPLLQEVFQEKVKKTDSKNEYADLEISSVFYPPKRIHQRVKNKIKGAMSDLQPNESLKPQSKLNVWFTGESIRPPGSKPFNAYLSYDRENFIQGNLYLPLWVLNLSWFGNQPGHGFTLKVETDTDLMKNRIIESEDLKRRKFCCAFINNPENLRMSVLKELERIGDVDIYGRVSGKYVRDKASVASNYRFMMCFENNLYPGYVSEKLLEAYQSGTFPLYWGSDCEEYFTKNAYLNLADFTIIDDFAKEIARLNDDLDLLASKMSGPLLQRNYDMDSLIAKLRHHLQIG